VRSLSISVFLLLVLAAPVLSATCPDCRHVSGCRPQRCCIDCASSEPEAELRRAVAQANRCAAQPMFRRSIEFTTTGMCTIDMTQTSRRANCKKDPANAGQGAVCLRGHDITIDGGNNVTFNYSGPIPCQACAGACPGLQPPLFAVHGRSNTLKKFTMQYFPSGIVIRAGGNHTVSHVTDNFICGHAVDVAAPRRSGGRGAGRNIRIEDNTFSGHTVPTAGHVCLDHLNRPSACGLDKAIQIDGGIVTVSGNTINRIGQPVAIIGGLGTHVVSENRTEGDAMGHNVCQSYTVAASYKPAAALFTGNAIDWCKFGIRVTDGAVVEANDNTITNAPVSAFFVDRLKGAGGELLKGAGNRIRNAGFFTVFMCQVGAIVDLNDPTARVDFGGGDFGDQPVIGGTRSPGGNVLCEGALNSVWNLTGGCTEGTGAGGSIGFRDNCVDILPPVVRDSPPGMTATGGIMGCPPAQCDF
jgi:hypothetical protein